MFLAAFKLLPYIFRLLVFSSGYRNIYCTHPRLWFYVLHSIRPHLCSWAHIYMCHFQIAGLLKVIEIDILLQSCKGHDICYTEKKVGLTWCLRGSLLQRGTTFSSIFMFVKKKCCHISAIETLFLLKVAPFFSLFPKGTVLVPFSWV